jgi:hypothetical protein
MDRPERFCSGNYQRPYHVEHTFCITKTNKKNIFLFQQAINQTTAWLAGIFGLLGLGMAILFGRNYCLLRKVSAEKERLQAELKAVFELVGTPLIDRNIDVK